MLNNMLQFNTAFLNSLATFLGSEPMIYFVGLFMLLIIIAMLCKLMHVVN